MKLCKATTPVLLKAHQRSVFRGRHFRWAVCFAAPNPHTVSILLDRVFLSKNDTLPLVALVLLGLFHAGDFAGNGHERGLLEFSVLTTESFETLDLFGRQERVTLKLALDE